MERPPGEGGDEERTGQGIPGDLGRCCASYWGGGKLMMTMVVIYEVIRVRCFGPDMLFPKGVCTDRIFYRYNTVLALCNCRLIAFQHLFYHDPKSAQTHVLVQQAIELRLPPKANFYFINFSQFLHKAWLPGQNISVLGNLPIDLIVICNCVVLFLITGS